MIAGLPRRLDGVGFLLGLVTSLEDRGSVAAGATTGLSIGFEDRSIIGINAEYSGIIVAGVVVSGCIDAVVSECWL